MLGTAYLDDSADASNTVAVVAAGFFASILSGKGFGVNGGKS
jgi:hypothetical protein